MKKIILILILFTMVCQAKSQIVKDTMPWCPPGASWLYSMITATESFYRQYNYEKDTLIDGKLAKKLNVDFIRIFGPGGTDIGYSKSSMEPEFIFKSNDSIFWFDKINKSFLFIYSFNAKPNDEFIIGNTWQICSSDSTYPKVDTINITQIYQDTFSNLIFDCISTSFNKKFYIGNIVKNIGSTTSPFPQINPLKCVAFRTAGGQTYESLVCYSDSLRGNINFFNSYAAECNFAKTFVKNITQNKTWHQSKIYPNPAHNFIKTENAENTKYQSLSIYNYLGQLVIELNDTKEIIDISGLNNGIYFVKLLHKSGTIETIKFLKN